ncbi:hypothetical protein PCIT_b0041 [Pseudoalteromonas citrea]|uniref:FAD dependent oxidoreductase domain-containing protein n=2 Tax=Pseudoalteromonas citrea TaxID=43655 RepID=A0AAD4ADW0_9GAMM|nr:FAD-dependent oxidoreductase [Pseudoalteromonas citrea]KAF7764129.1 hypothetical protein PCIT_b0041 [Pseudoalteromonas citrea]
MKKYYDPLTHPHCQAQPYAASYWASSTTLPTPKPPPASSQTFEVAIIGGGFSGLLTAYYLASHYNIDCCVIEANQVGYGASARNAGFVLKGSGRLSYPKIVNKWGMSVAKGIYSEFSESVERVSNLITEHSIACDSQERGYLKVAHSLNAMQSLKEQTKLLTELGDSATLLSKEHLKAHFMNHAQAYGAMRLSDGFGINPLKLLLGYRQITLNAGVTLFENSLVRSSHSTSNGHELVINDTSISIRAKNIVFAGNAYNNKVTHPIINNRYIPIMSSIMVTRPLNQLELSLTGLKTHQVTMDTRTLKYYYRLLPDKRLLFGGRGAVFASQQQHPRFLKGLKQGLTDCFPCLNGISHDYYWSGFVAATLDDMPHVNFKDSIGYILGYCGAGVSFSAQAAFRLAQQISGQSPPNLPLYNTSLPYVPFPKFRRLGQLAFYQYATVADRL